MDRQGGRPAGRPVGRVPDAGQLELQPSVVRDPGELMYVQPSSSSVRAHWPDPFRAPHRQALTLAWLLWTERSTKAWQPPAVPEWLMSSWWARGRDGSAGVCPVLKQAVTRTVSGSPATSSAAWRVLDLRPEWVRVKLGGLGCTKAEQAKVIQGGESAGPRRLRRHHEVGFRMAVSTRTSTLVRVARVGAGGRMSARGITTDAPASARSVVTVPGFMRKTLPACVLPGGQWAWPISPSKTVSRLICAVAGAARVGATSAAISAAAAAHPRMQWGGGEERHCLSS